MPSYSKSWMKAMHTVLLDFVRYTDVYMNSTEHWTLKVRNPLLASIFKIKQANFFHLGRRFKFSPVFIASNPLVSAVKSVK